MDDETTLLGFRPHIRNDTYMVEPTAEIPRHYITGKIVVAVVANISLLLIMRCMLA